MTKRKKPHRPAKGSKVSEPLCDECRIDTLAVALAPRSYAWWLCAKHLDRWIRHNRSSQAWVYDQLKKETNT